MSSLPEALVALCLLAVTVMIHASGMAAVLRRITVPSRLELTYWRVTTLLVSVAWVLLILHLIEIALWAIVYWWLRCLPDLEASLYFSGVTYATLGYGDVVLPREWRLLGPLEALTGILMTGLSVSFFFVVVSKATAARSDAINAK